MSEIKYIHVVTFHIPFPPNYGGAIDVFYKLKALNKAGYRIILHTFLYDGKRSIELEKICEKVYYYERDISLKSHLSLKPFIVQSRRTEKLIADLLIDDYPILFEGLHTCFYLNDKRLQNRKKYVRMHNIEHDYYGQLALQTHFGIKKIFYYLEALRLKSYETVLKDADRILAISKDDADYLKQKFPDKDVRLLHCFFDDSAVSAESSQEKYILYHGNLHVEENITAVLFLLKKVLPLLSENYKLVIAGRNPSPLISSEISKNKNVTLIANPNEKKLNNLLYNATVNILITFQTTGIKLKLLNTLCKSRGHCIVNNEMLHGNDLARFCVVANRTQEIASAINSLMASPSTGISLEERVNAVREMGYNDISPLVSE